MNDWNQGVLFHFGGVLVIGTTPFVKHHQVLRQILQPLQGRGRQRESADLETEIQLYPQTESYMQMGPCQEGCSSLGKFLKSGSRHVGWVCWFPNPAVISSWALPILSMHRWCLFWLHHPWSTEPSAWDVLSYKSCVHWLHSPTFLGCSTQSWQIFFEKQFYFF